jgi:hypothetical protein
MQRMIWHFHFLKHVRYVQHETRRIIQEKLVLLCFGYWSNTPFWDLTCNILLDEIILFIPANLPAWLQTHVSPPSFSFLSKCFFNCVLHFLCLTNSFTRMIQYRIVFSRRIQICNKNMKSLGFCGDILEFNIVLGKCSWNRWHWFWGGSTNVAKKYTTPGFFQLLKNCKIWFYVDFMVHLDRN